MDTNWLNSSLNTFSCVLIRSIDATLFEVREKTNKTHDLYFADIYFALPGLYHANAVLTMSSNFVGIADNKTKNLNFYIEKSRSFIRTVNPKPMHNLFQGPAEIVNIFGSIGNTEHDFKSFTIDLLNYTVWFLHNNQFNQYNLWSMLFFNLCCSHRKP